AATPLVGAAGERFDPGARRQREGAHGPRVDGPQHAPLLAERDLQEERLGIEQRLDLRRLERPRFPKRGVARARAPDLRLRRLHVLDQARDLAVDRREPLVRRAASLQAQPALRLRLQALARRCETLPERRVDTLPQIGPRLLEEVEERPGPRLFADRESRRGVAEIHQELDAQLVGLLPRGEERSAQLRVRDRSARRFEERHGLGERTVRLVRTAEPPQRAGAAGERLRKADPVARLAALLERPRERLERRLRLPLPHQRFAQLPPGDARLDAVAGRVEDRGRLPEPGGRRGRVAAGERRLAEEAERDPFLLAVLRRAGESERRAVLLLRLRPLAAPPCERPELVARRRLAAAVAERPFERERLLVVLARPVELAEHRVAGGEVVERRRLRPAVAERAKRGE